MSNTTWPDNELWLSLHSKQTCRVILGLHDLHCYATDCKFNWAMPEWSPFKSSNIDTIKAIYSFLRQETSDTKPSLLVMFHVFSMKLHDIWVCLEIRYLQIHLFIVIFPIKIVIWEVFEQCSIPKARNKLETNWVWKPSWPVQTGHQPAVPSRKVSTHAKKK